MMENCFRNVQNIRKNDYVNIISPSYHMSPWLMCSSTIFWIQFIILSISPWKSWVILRLEPQVVEVNFFHGERFNKINYISMLMLFTDANKYPFKQRIFFDKILSK